ncbi:hypothetical protein [Kaistella palustris]|nr:hypothetical protein [Kaistella palustris]
MINYFSSGFFFVKGSEPFKMMPFGSKEAKLASHFTIFKTNIFG